MRVRDVDGQSSLNPNTTPPEAPSTACQVPDSSGPRWRIRCAGDGAGSVGTFEPAPAGATAKRPTVHGFSMPPLGDCGASSGEVATTEAVAAGLMARLLSEARFGPHRRPRGRRGLHCVVFDTRLADGSTGAIPVGPAYSDTGAPTVTPRGPGRLQRLSQCRPQRGSGGGLPVVFDSWRSAAMLGRPSPSVDAAGRKPWASVGQEGITPEATPQSNCGSGR